MFWEDGKNIFISFYFMPPCSLVGEPLQEHLILPNVVAWTKSYLMKNSIKTSGVVITHYPTSVLAAIVIKSELKNKRRIQIWFCWQVKRHVASIIQISKTVFYKNKIKQQDIGDTESCTYCESSCSNLCIHSDTMSPNRKETGGEQVEMHGSWNCKRFLAKLKY